MAGLVLGGRNAQRVAMITIVAGLAVAIAAAMAMPRSGAPLVYLLGGWAPPLGIALRADGLSIVMMLAVAVVIAGIGVYARGDFGTPPGATEARAPLVYWLLLLAVWGSLNLVFVSGDLFTLYVALELLTFAGVPLVCLDGKGETLRAALRYLDLRARRFHPLPAGRRVAVWRVRHARHPAAGGAHPSFGRDVRRRRADDDGAARQDRAVPVAPVAAARACGGPTRRERRAVGAGGQGIVLHRHPVVVRRGARASRARGGAAPGWTRRRGDSVRQRHRAPAGAVEAPDRVLDAGADRLPLPDVSARLRRKLGRVRARRCADGRHAAGDFARHREGGDVHGRRPDLQGVRS